VNVLCSFLTIYALLCSNVVVHLSDHNPCYGRSGGLPHGRGLPQNFEEAAHWYRKAAEQGDAMAQLCLGSCFVSGRGVPESEVEAVPWFKKAVHQGLLDAQYRLGMMYELGCCVMQSDVEALRWYEQAANQGHAQAAEKLALLRARKTLLEHVE